MAAGDVQANGLDSESVKEQDKENDIDCGCGRKCLVKKHISANVT